MKYVFNYEETLMRRIAIHADNLGEAILELHRRINDEEIILDAQDFAGARVLMPVPENNMITIFDQDIPMDEKDTCCMDIEIDAW